MTRVMAISASAVRAVPALPALQAALAAEDAAIFGYGVAGAHLSGSRKAAAEQDWTGHNEARDTLTAMISALGATPVAAQAFYRLPFEVTDPASAACKAGKAGTARTAEAEIAITRVISPAPPRAWHRRPRCWRTVEPGQAAR